MKAWVLNNIRELKYMDISDPQIKDGEALVKVQCAGICASDVARVFTTGAYQYPIVLGHEFSGTVEEVYNAESKPWIGKKVGVFPLTPCFQCISCKQGLYETCSNYNYIGSRCNGGFAEYVAVPTWNLIEIPGTINFEDAAMLEPAAVALHAVKQIGREKVKSAAVFGTGPIGKLILQWLQIFGVHDVFLLGRNSDTVAADVCFEACGHADVFRRCILSVNPNGQIVLVGNPDGDFRLEQKYYWQILRKQVKVYGTWNSRFPEEWSETIEKIQKKVFLPSALVTHRYDFDEFDRALDMMYNRKEPRSKVLLYM